MGRSACCVNEFAKQAELIGRALPWPKCTCSRLVEGGVPCSMHCRENNSHTEPMPMTIAGHSKLPACTTINGSATRRGCRVCTANPMPISIFEIIDWQGNYLSNDKPATVEHDGKRSQDAQQSGSCASSLHPGPTHTRLPSLSQRYTRVALCMYKQTQIYIHTVRTYIRTRIRR